MMKYSMLLLLFCAAPAWGQFEDKEAGKQAYEQVCAVCHGLDARGSGPITPHLVVRPPDLTRLQADNGGQFPADMLYHIIDGRAEVAIHGPREMPVWGRRFGGTDANASQKAIEARIHAIIDYLADLQRGPQDP